jgi:hypothetical protein
VDALILLIAAVLAALTWGLVVLCERVRSR